MSKIELQTELFNSQRNQLFVEEDNSRFSFDELSEMLLKKMVKVTKAEMDKHDGNLPM